MGTPVSETNITFTNLATLESCISVSGNTCTAGSSMELALPAAGLSPAAHVTIDGGSKVSAQVASYGFKIRQANVTLEGISFTGPGPTHTTSPSSHPTADCTATNPTPDDLSGCATPVDIIEGGNSAVITNNTFAECGDKCIAVQDSTVKSPAPTDIQVTHNTFENSFYGLLDLNRQLGQQTTLTLSDNTWEGIYRRAPRINGDVIGTETGDTWKPGASACDAGGFGPSAVGGATLNISDSSALPGACSAINTSNATDSQTTIVLDSTNEPIGPGHVNIGAGTSGLVGSPTGGSTSQGSTPVTSTSSDPIKPTSSTTIQNKNPYLPTSNILK